MGCFIGGLRDAVKYEIIAKIPSTIEDAIRLARVEEEKISNQRRGFKGPFQKQINNSGTIGAGVGSGSAAVPHTLVPMKRLTPQELGEKREKEPYFLCDEKYVTGHECQHKKLFQLEICPKGSEEEPEWGFEEQEKGEPQSPIELSANLMTGVMGVSSIRLIGKIMEKEVSFLVDSGATHNLIDPATTRRIGLPLQVINTFEVKVADGEKMKGKAYCRDT